VSNVIDKHVHDALALVIEATMLRAYGEIQPCPDGMKETPSRLWRALQEMTCGYKDDPAQILAKDFAPDGYDQVVALKGIDFSSLCEHHLMPFHGTVGIAYLPGGRVVGLSKLARLVNCFARRFQIQERMTHQIAEALAGIGARGVAVVVKGTHTCMTARGVLKPGSVMVTSSLRGVFLEDQDARSEALGLLEE